MARKPKKPASPVTPESPGTNVPGVSTDPATNMMMADIAMRSGTTLLRHLVERKFLKGRYGKESAKEIVQNRGLKHTIASVA
ncbi:MAG: hypothetical protein WAT93_02500, partial [Pontixanthobacter sp.]